MINIFVFQQAVF